MCASVSVLSNGFRAALEIWHPHAQPGGLGAIPHDAADYASKQGAARKKLATKAERGSEEGSISIFLELHPGIMLNVKNIKNEN